MNRLKHILVVVALLVTMLPCGHAEMHHNHQHDGVVLCSLALEPCSCHSCKDSFCFDQGALHVRPVLSSLVIRPPRVPMLFFVAPKHWAVISIPPPVSNNTLAILQTIQLLI